MGDIIVGRFTPSLKYCSSLKYLPLDQSNQGLVVGAAYEIAAA
jgi:hypothetical protein